MTRRVYMWIAVASLIGVALVSGASSLASVSIIDYVTPSPPSQRMAMQVIEVCSFIEMVLFPIAALSIAAYIFLLERDVRQRLASRGFEVELGGPGSSK